MDALTATNDDVLEAAQLRLPGDFRRIPLGVDTELFKPGEGAEAVRARMAPRRGGPRGRPRSARSRELPGWELVVLRTRALTGRPHVPRALRPPREGGARDRPRARAREIARRGRIRRGRSAAPAGRGSRRPPRACPAIDPPGAAGQPELVAAAMARLAEDETWREKQSEPPAAQAERESFTALADTLEREVYRGVVARRRTPSRAGRAARRPAADRLSTSTCTPITRTTAPSRSRELLDHAEAMGLGAIAITDHNVFTGAQEAVELARGRDLIVIPGEEVMTPSGEVIGLFLKEEIPRDMPMDVTVHGDPRAGRHRLPAPPVRPAALDPGPAHAAPACSRTWTCSRSTTRACLLDAYNDEALRFARKYNLLMGAGSDAHVLQGVGTGALRMRAFDDARGVPHLAPLGRGAAPAQVARLPPGAQVDGAGAREAHEIDGGCKARVGTGRADRELPPEARARVHERHLGALPEEGRGRDERTRPRDRGGRGTGSGARARIGPSARRHHAPEAPAADLRDPRGRRVLRPRGPGGAEVDPAAARRSDGDLRDELLQVRRTRTTTRPTRFLTRELHIVQPKLVVVMGQDSLACLNPTELPAGEGARGDAGDDPAADADGGGAARPGHRHRARRAGGEEGLLGRLQGNRTLVVRSAAVLALLAALVVWSEIAPHLGHVRTGAAWPSSRSASRRRCSRMVWLALPARDALGPVRLGVVAAGARAGRDPLRGWPTSSYAANFTKFAAATAIGWWFLTFFEAPWWVLLVARDHHPGGSLLGRAGADEGDHGEPAARCSTRCRSSCGSPGRASRRAARAAARAAGRAVLRPLPRRVRAFALRVGPTWVAMVLSFGATISAARPLRGEPASPRCRSCRSRSCS